MAVTKHKTESNKVKVLPQDKGYTITLEKENMTHVIYLRQDEFMELYKEMQLRLLHK